MYFRYEGALELNSYYNGASRCVFKVRTYSKFTHLAYHTMKVLRQHAYLITHIFISKNANIIRVLSNRSQCNEH